VLFLFGHSYLLILLSALSRHFQHPEKMYATISNIQLFRDYLHYHIKCSKAYLHSRMRARVAAFLRVLNRAKQEKPETERRTITYVSYSSQMASLLIVTRRGRTVIQR
jgi:actin related protein 2/3 complex subunit 2